MCILKEKVITYNSYVYANLFHVIFAFVHSYKPIIPEIPLKQKESWENVVFSKSYELC